MQLRFLELVEVLEQMPFDDYILDISGLNFTKLDIDELDALEMFQR